MIKIIVNHKSFELYLTSGLIQARIAEIANDLNDDLKNKSPLFIGILNGCFMFASDLLKQVVIDAQVSFLKLASYQGTKTTGVVKELIGLNHSITDRNVVILEDIVDTGVTLEHIVNQLSEYNPASLKIVTLILKPSSYTKDIKLDYVGFKIPNDFIIGYGLDYEGYGRNLKDIYKIIG